MKLTQERLKEILDYDPETGIFTWRVAKAYRIKVADIAGCLDKDGYWRIKIDNKPYLAHRLAYLWMEGYVPENDTDHKDRNKINNRWDNLREASRGCNMRNRNVFKNNASGITGISFHKKTNKWRSQIGVPKKIHIGSFDNLIDAVRSRWEAEVKYNFPNCNSTSSAYLYLKEHQAI